MLIAQISDPHLLAPKKPFQGGSAWRRTQLELLDA